MVRHGSLIFIFPSLFGWWIQNHEKQTFLKIETGKQEQKVKKKGKEKTKRNCLKAFFGNGADLTELRDSLEISSV